jgi:branched-subunit amino acid aminotransferase/4-amino-4-deoxychorismate lyase
MSDPIQVIDTFKITNKGIPLKKYHIQRSLEAFQTLGSPQNEFQLRAMYQQIEDKNQFLQKEMKARITFDSTDLKKSVCDISNIDILPQPLTLELAQNYFQLSGRGLQNYKISKRDYWKTVLSHSHCVDVIGINQDNCVTETSRFNLFLLKDNRLLTPSLNSGCINGVFRRYLLEQGYYELGSEKIPLIEKDILTSEIKNYEIYVGNSLRGMYKAILI